MQIKKAHAEFYRSNVVELDYALLNKLPKGQKVCYVCKSCGKTENTTLGQYTNRKYKSDHLCIKCHLSYVNNIPSFKESNLRKSMESSIKKFGVPVPIMSKDVRDAFEASMLDKYGVKNAFLLKTFQEKAEKTQQEKFGTKRWIQSEYAFKRTYGSFLRKYYYNGIYFDSSWELADTLPTFHFNSRAAKRTAMNRLREQGWWKPKRSMAYAQSLALRYGLPLKPYIYESLTDPRNYPNLRYEYYQSKILPWILKENPEEALDIKYGLNSSSPKRRRQAQQRQNELFDLGEAYFYEHHHLKRPEPVIDEEQAREQLRPHKKRNILLI